MLTNDIVSFEQLGPDIYTYSMGLERNLCLFGSSPSNESIVQIMAIKLYTNVVKRS